jgi:putative two-component system response regulator
MKAFVLIVDDVESNRFVLRDIILEMGYQPILAESGQQALQVLERHRPQLVLLDIAMPGMDGYEVCRIIKENVETRDIPVIFISAFDDPKDIVKGFELGSEDYVTKPFIPAVVKARVGFHLKLAETNQQMHEMNRQLQASVREQLRQMELEKKNVLYALTRVARENACYDKEHMERLQYNCRLLTEAMQLSKEYGSLISDTYIETIEMAAPLCDLGNVAIPTHILQKGEALTPEERKIMQNHTIVGVKILEDVKTTGDYNDFIQVSLEIAHYHHENWDGTGYPEGLKGGEIPLSAQIVSVVSAYCALTEKRVFREAYSMEEAVARLEKDAGTQFNPVLFGILKMVYRQMH